MTQPLKFILEAAILAAHQPLTIEQLSELFDESVRPSHNTLAQTIEMLSADCVDRGVELVEVASGFRYQIKTDVYPHVARLWTERQSRYSRALLETLSLIAYRQPITRAEIEAVRGVAVSSHIVRTLEEREWIRVVGHREVPGRPALYSTTRAFLDYFKLKSLEELPTLSEIKDLDNMAPELDFSSHAPLAVEPIAIEQIAASSALETPAPAPVQVPAVSLNTSNENPSETEDEDTVEQSSLAAAVSIDDEDTALAAVAPTNEVPKPTPLEAAVNLASEPASQPSNDDTSTKE